MAAGRRSFRDGPTCGDKTRATAGVSSLQKADGAGWHLARWPISARPGTRSSMTSPAPNQSAKNVAPTAQRIDLFTRRPNRQFLTVSLDKDLKNRRHHINAGPGSGRSPRIENANGDSAA